MSVRTPSAVETSEPFGRTASLDLMTICQKIPASETANIIANPTAGPINPNHTADRFKRLPSSQSMRRQLCAAMGEFTTMPPGPAHPPAVSAFASAM